jgi:hypothetical protein
MNLTPSAPADHAAAHTTTRVQRWTAPSIATVSLVVAAQLVLVAGPLFLSANIVERLTTVLAESGAVHRRLANLSVKPAGDIEALPDLHGLWTRVVDSRDTEAVAAFVEELRVVETDISALRREIHTRLDEATGQLIARYRTDPTLALTALPDIGLR